MNKYVGPTFGGRNPKIGVNHVHWSRFHVSLMYTFFCVLHVYFLLYLDVLILCFISCIKVLCSFDHYDGLNCCMDNPKEGATDIIKIIKWRTKEHKSIASVYFGFELAN